MLMNRKFMCLSVNFLNFVLVKGNLGNAYINTRQCAQSGKILSYHVECLEGVDSNLFVQRIIMHC